MMLIFISYNRFGPFRLLQWLQQRRRKKKRTQGARGARVGACPTDPSSCPAPPLSLFLHPRIPKRKENQCVMPCVRGLTLVSLDTEGKFQGPRSQNADTRALSCKKKKTWSLVSWPAALRARHAPL